MRVIVVNEGVIYNKAIKIILTLHNEVKSYDVYDKRIRIYLETMIDCS